MTTKRKLEREAHIRHTCDMEFERRVNFAKVTRLFDQEVVARIRRVLPDLDCEGWHSWQIDRYLDAHPEVDRQIDWTTPFAAQLLTDARGLPRC